MTEPPTLISYDASPVAAGRDKRSSRDRRRRVSVSSISVLDRQRPAATTRCHRQAALPERADSLQGPEPPINDSLDEETASALDIDALAAGWLSSLAASERAIRSNTSQLGAAHAAAELSQLRDQREHVANLLENFAHGRSGGTLLARCLRSPISLRLLGLPPGISACVFDVEGVLTTSAEAHRAAWCATLDSFLFARAERLGRAFVPFDPIRDYSNYLDAKPRLAGLRAFMASRGISLPEGEPSDPAGAETVCGLANEKQEVLRRHLEQEGVDAFSGSRVYLEVARIVGARRAVVSASANTALVLCRAGIAHLVEARVDGLTLESAALRPKPAPDMILAACAQLGVEPDQAAAFETTLTGIAAARAAGAGATIAVARDGNTTAFSASDADLVVNDLAELVEHVVTAS